MVLTQRRAAVFRRVKTLLSLSYKIKPLIFRENASLPAGPVGELRKDRNWGKHIFGGGTKPQIPAWGNRKITPLEIQRHKVCLGLKP